MSLALEFLQMSLATAAVFEEVFLLPHKQKFLRSTMYKENNHVVYGSSQALVHV